MDTFDKSEIDIKKFKKIKKIAKGSYGSVYEVKEIESGTIYAAKILDNLEIELDEEKLIDREVDIMLFARHPTIIKFIGYSRTDFKGYDYITIIMEYATKGSLGWVLEQIRKGIKLPNFTNIGCPT